MVCLLLELNSTSSPAVLKLECSSGSAGGLVKTPGVGCGIYISSKFSRDNDDAGLESTGEPTALGFARQPRIKINTRQHNLRRNTGQVLYTASDLLVHFTFFPSRQGRPRFTLSLFLKHMMGLGRSVKLKEGMSSSVIRIFQEMGKMPVTYFCADFKPEIQDCLQIRTLYQSRVLRKWYRGTEKNLKLFFFYPSLCQTGRRCWWRSWVPAAAFKGKNSHCLSAQAFCNIAPSCDIVVSCRSADHGPHNTPSLFQFQVNGSGLLD